MKWKTFFKDEMENVFKDEMENIVLINEKMNWKTFFKDEMENVVLINEKMKWKTLFSLMKRVRSLAQSRCHVLGLHPRFALLLFS